MFAPKLFSKLSIYLSESIHLGVAIAEYALSVKEEASYVSYSALYRKLGFCKIECLHQFLKQKTCLSTRLPILPVSKSIDK